MEGMVLSMAKSGHLAASTSEEGSIQVIENTNDEQIASSCTDICDASEEETCGSKTGKKGENPGSVTGNTISSSSKSAPNDSRKNSKCASSDSAPASGNSRKSARKGWTMLKQIAEKDELERKEKMDNFVIPLKGVGVVELVYIQYRHMKGFQEI
ncbi:uncharacterized protein C2845_PM17G01600 [Panicum miliaceum]|uniref:Uncharacterized protein n=1 Tax=Panicum miliaceum TaxID=4540 RepID=A0A3L6Q060_PANMI|nr:uncharacterized protein C2845_PM17G01600 [Panicum miliaceum]